MNTFFVLATLVPRLFQLSPSDEIEALRKADQAARQWTSPPSMEDIHRLERGDFAREERIRQLLREDKVQSGNDLDGAALILQHGSDPDDFLLARELSILAYIKGSRSTLQTAAEDRYLLRLGRKQRFGNQFRFEGSKTVFEPMDEEVPFGVTDALRAEFLIAPVALIREKGLNAFGEAIPNLAVQLKIRSDPEWIAKANQTPLSRELAALARRPEAPESLGHVLEAYREGRLATPENYFHAASVLALSPRAEAVLLANEMAALAASRGNRPARRLFAVTWDRFAKKIGKEERYGTSNGEPSVSPVVAREFGLLPKRKASSFKGVRYRWEQPRSRTAAPKPKRLPGLAPGGSVESDSFSDQSQRTNW